MLFLLKSVAVTAFELPGSLWHLEGLAVKGTLRTSLWTVSECEPSTGVDKWAAATVILTGP